MLSNLVKRELKSRYKGSALGFLWTVLTPLFMAVIYVFFLRLLARGVPMESVIIGIFAWQFTAQSVNQGLMAITGNSNLVKKVFFPREILPTAATLANLINFLFSILVALVLVTILLWRGGNMMTFSGLLLLPFLIILHTVFNLAISFFLSAINVYFRDAQHLVGVGLTAWFFATPAMYDLALVQGILEQHPLVYQLYLLNPVTVIITAYRALLLPGVEFPWTVTSIISLVMPFVLLIIGRFTFNKMQRNFADML